MPQLQAGGNWHGCWVFIIHSGVFWYLYHVTKVLKVNPQGLTILNLLKGKKNEETSCTLTCFLLFNAWISLLLLPPSLLAPNATFSPPNWLNWYLPIMRQKFVISTLNNLFRTLNSFILLRHVFRKLDQL